MLHHYANYILNHYILPYFVQYIEFTTTAKQDTCLFIFFSPPPWLGTLKTGALSTCAHGDITFEYVMRTSKHVTFVDFADSQTLKYKFMF